MAASGNLCSVTDVKQYLEITGAEHDALLAALVASASETIESFCRRRFLATDYTEYHDGMGSALLLLDQHPVQSVAEIRVAADRDFDAVEPLGAEEYVLYAAEGLVQRTAGVFPRGLRNVRVQYSAGYGSVPDDVKQACVVLAAHWFHRGCQGADGIARESLGEYAVAFAPAGLPRQVIEMLAPYLELYV